MSRLYEHLLFQFRYPEDWELVESPAPDGHTVSLQSPYSMFMFLTCYDGSVAVAVANQALETMASEYERLDSDPVREPIAGVVAVGHDVDFISFDLTNTCWIRALQRGGKTLLIFAQTSDFDLDLAEPAFRAICASLKFATAGQES